MKLAKKLGNLCEDLDSGDLSKFWQQFEQHCLKASKETIKDSTLLLNEDAAEIEMEYQTGQELPDDVKEEISSIGFIVKQGLKDLVSLILNEYVLKDDASSDIDDEKALDYTIKKLKGHKADFYGNTTVDFMKNKEHEYYEEYEIIGSGIIKDLKYDKDKDILTIDHFEVTDVSEANQI